jgi:predicted RNase H-like HicB family nuclease
MSRKKFDYLIKLTYDKDYKGYVADVVNLYGCMSQGKTKKEALANAEKAIQAYMQTVAKGGRNSEFTKKTVDITIPSLSVNA